MKWHFQGSPHDTHDWDGTQVPVLFDAEIDGKPRKLLAQANRNGFFFVLDRTNGQPIVSKPFIETANWFTGIDKKGQPIPNPDKEPQIPGVLVSPSTDGAANYPAPSFNPDTGLFYINATESWSLYYLTERISNAVGWGGAFEYHTGVFDSALRALDYRTGEVKWEHRYPGLGFWSSTYPGMLSTAGKLLFTGDPVGNFIAYDPAQAARCCGTPTLARIVCNSPITYMLDGRQYVVVASGDTLYAFSLYDKAQQRDAVLGVATSSVDGPFPRASPRSSTAGISRAGTSAEPRIRDRRPMCASKTAPSSCGSSPTARAGFSSPTGATRTSSSISKRSPTGAATAASCFDRPKADRPIRSSWIRGTAPATCSATC